MKIYKIAGGVRDFDWEDDRGEIWSISYRDIDPAEMYSNGKALSNREIMAIMIQSIQNKHSDHPIGKDKVGYFLDRFPLLADEFFERVRETEAEYREERRIEERQISMDPDGYFQR